MTEDEAKNQAGSINSKCPEWFCPLIKDTCNTNCYCYVASSAYKASTYSGDGWMVMQPHCTNASMIGNDA